MSSTFTVHLVRNDCARETGLALIIRKVECGPWRSVCTVQRLIPNAVRLLGGVPTHLQPDVWHQVLALTEFQDKD